MVTAPESTPPETPEAQDAPVKGRKRSLVALSFGGGRVRGEAVITRGGIEGGAIYALSPALRDAIDASGDARLTIDLLPDMDAGEIARRLGAPRGKQSVSNMLRKSISLSPVAIGLAQEATRGKFGDLAPQAFVRRGEFGRALGDAALQFVVRLAQRQFRAPPL